MEKINAEKINLAREPAQLTEFWSQRVLASGNDNLFKVAKGIGSTNWHSHDDQDEVFLVIDDDSSMMTAGIQAQRR